MHGMGMRTPLRRGITQEGKKMTIAAIREYTEEDKARVKGGAY